MPGLQNFCVPSNECPPAQFFLASVPLSAILGFNATSARVAVLPPKNWQKPVLYCSLKSLNSADGAGYFLFKSRLALISCYEGILFALASRRINFRP
jgi:hypothetical protein